MPPKTKITKDMIIDAAFNIVREEGADKINARNISEKLNCSTQPVLYHFATIDEIREETYKKADIYHSEYITNIRKENNTLLTPGILYIRFAQDEKELFRFLFQSDKFAKKSLKELIDQEEIKPVLENMQKMTSATMEETKRIFSSIFLMVHGYASLIANNAMVYDEKAMTELLDTTLSAVASKIKGGRI